MARKGYKKVFTEFNFGRTITIWRGNILYTAYIDGYRASRHFDDFDECLNHAREIVLDMPEWLVKKIGH